MQYFTARFHNFVAQTPKFAFWVAGGVLSHQFQAFLGFP